MGSYIGGLYVYGPGEFSQSNLPLFYYPQGDPPLLSDTKNLTANLYLGYQDLYNDLTNYYNVPGGDARIYWLQNAIEVNSNNAIENPNDPLGYSNTFIRSVTRSGLLYDNSATAGSVEKKVQDNSDTIGKYVLGAIYGYANGQINFSNATNTTPGIIPGIDDFIQKDVGSAVAKGGQSIQGWGGAFYYWDTPFSNGGTVGSQIESNVNNYEEFLAIDAKAIEAVAYQDVSSILTPINAVISEINTFMTALKAQIPWSVTEDLAERITDSVQYGYGGNPNVIDGYTAILDKSGNVTGWFYTYGGGFVGSADATEAANLNSIRAVRLQDQLGTPGAAWQSNGTGTSNQVKRALTAQASAATVPPASALSASNFQLLAAARSFENQSLTLNVLPTGAALSTVQTSGANAPMALFGTAAIVNGQLVYTPKQDFVGKDFISFTTFDGTTYKSSVVPVTIQGFVHQTPSTASDGSTTTKYFDTRSTSTADRRSPSRAPVKPSSSRRTPARRRSAATMRATVSSSAHPPSPIGRRCSDRRANREPTP